jgi:ATP-dependent DNA helicase RecG
MTTTLTELQRWMDAPREGEHLEFKQAENNYDPVKLVKYCVAIANEGGGHIVLGISDKNPRKVVGSQAFRNPNDIKTFVRQKIGFRVDVEELATPDGRRVVIFHVPPRPVGTAYHYEGAYLMRSGEELVPMTEDQLRKIFNEGKPDFLADIALDNLSADDVVRLLDTQSYFDLIKVPYPANREGVLKRFESEKLVTHHDGRYAVTSLSAVLFAKKLEDFPTVWRKAPRVIVYDGKSKLATKLDQPGTKGYATEFQGLIDFINAQVKSNEIIEKALRRQVKMFPEIAIRELVANALIHQDFNESGASVMVELYDDRIEISNPGKPFIPPERFIDEYQSRNERLADLMRRMGICEEKGSGIDKVIQSAEDYQLPAPDFRVGERRTTAVMFAHQEFEDMSSEDRIRACYQHCVLRYLMNEKMTNQSLRERFKLPQTKAESVSRVIRDTVDAGRIKLDDPKNTSKRYARYVPTWA